MAKVVIDFYGVKRYYNDRGDIHREDGPAIIYPTGKKYWKKNGLSPKGNNGPHTRNSNGITITRNVGAYYDWPNGRKVTYVEGVITWPNAL